MSQLMPLPLTVSCFSKIQIGFTFLVPAHLGSPGKRAVKWVCKWVCVHLPVGLVMGDSELTSQSDDRRVHGSTVKEIEQYDAACTFVASVPAIFRQDGSSVKAIIKHPLDPVSFTQS